MYELGKYQKQEHEKIIEVCNSKKIDKCIFIGEIFYRLKITSLQIIFIKTRLIFLKIRIKLMKPIS